MVCSICKCSGHNKRTCSGANGTSTNSQPGTPKHSGKSANIPERGLSTSTFSDDSLGSKIHSDMKALAQIVSGDSKNCSSHKKGSVNSKAKVNSTKEVCELCEEDDHFLGSCPLLSAIVKPKIAKKLQNILSKDKVSDVPASLPSSKTKKLGIKWLNEEALNRLLEGPSKADGPGYIYMYVEANDVDRFGDRAFKIGLSENLPDRRIHIQELKNKKEYVKVFSIKTPFKYMTETMIKKQLSAYHTPKSSGDGRTEWFTGKREIFEETIRRVLREVKGLYSE